VHAALPAPYRSHSGTIESGFDPLQIHARLCERGVRGERRAEGLRGRAGEARALERHAEVVLEGRVVGRQRCGPCEWPDGRRLAPHPDVEKPQVVECPHVGVVPRDRRQIGVRGFVHQVELVIRPALQPQHLGRGIDLHGQLELVERVGRAVGLDQHAREAQHALQVLRVALERRIVGGLRRGVVAGLPRGETAHVVPPRVVRLALDVGRKQDHGLVVPTLAERGLGDLVRDGPHHDGRAGHRRRRRDLMRNGCDLRGRRRPLDTGLASASLRRLAAGQQVGQHQDAHHRDFPHASADPVAVEGDSQHRALLVVVAPMAPLPVAVPAEEKGTREATLGLPSAITVKH
jgi:hypothetical protein